MASTDEAIRFRERDEMAHVHLKYRQPGERDLQAAPLTLSVAIDFDYYRRLRAAGRFRWTGKAERRYPDRPWRCQIGADTFLAFPWAIALPDGSIDLIDCDRVLEHTRDDLGAMREFARLLKPGGRLRLRVPATGPAAGFDSLNLYKYFSDVFGQRGRARETLEIGWRRHFSADDIDRLGEGAFRLTGIERHGVGVSELIHLGALFGTHWLTYRPRTYDTARRSIDALGSLERRIRSPWGFYVTFELERTPLQ